MIDQHIWQLMHRSGKVRVLTGGEEPVICVPVCQLEQVEEVLRSIGAGYNEDKNGRIGLHYDLRPIVLFLGLGADVEKIQAALDAVD